MVFMAENLKESWNRKKNERREIVENKEERWKVCGDYIKGKNVQIT